MCGRYVSPDDAAIERHWHLGRGNNPNPFRNLYNVAPTMRVPILRRATDADGLALAGARWSFIPHWWKQPKPPTMTINARSEEAAIKPMWRDSYKHGKAHVLMPALAYYEWKAMERLDPVTGEVTNYKQPYCLYLPDHEPFCFAALASWWHAPGKEEPVLTCALLTQAASQSVAPVHDRMPVILPVEQFDAWTDPARTTAAATAEILAQALTEIQWHPVSTRVNNARTDDAALMQPIALPRPTDR